MTKDVFRFVSVNHLLTVSGEVLIGAIIAFFMELAEYLLVSYTSSLTLSVSGIIKVLNMKRIIPRFSLIKSSDV